MKAMIMDMCILSHKTQCFLMFRHVVGVGAGKLRGLTVKLLSGHQLHGLLGNGDFPRLISLHVSRHGISVDGYINVIPVDFQWNRIKHIVGIYIYSGFNIW